MEAARLARAGNILCQDVLCQQARTCCKLSFIVGRWNQFENLCHIAKGSITIQSLWELVVLDEATSSTDIVFNTRMAAVMIGLTC